MAVRLATRSSRARIGILAGVVVAAVAAVVLGRLALRSGPASSAEPSSTTAAAPAFAFRMDGFDSVTTAPTQGTNATVRETANAVRKVLGQLYRDAFLDPAAWPSGTFEAALAAFDTDALGDARTDLGLLTLGAGAARAFERVEPVEGTVSVTVLLGPSGAPVTAEATVSFSATAVSPTGEETTLVSEGSYFLRTTPEGWRIYGYEVERADRPAVGEA